MPCAVMLDWSEPDDNEARVLDDVLSRLAHLGWHVVQAEGVQPLKAGLQFDLMIMHLPRRALRHSLWLQALQTCDGPPVVVLMDPPDPWERVIALELGADAVMLAPHDATDVVARIQAVARRTTAAHTAPNEAALMRDWLRQAMESGQWGLTAAERLVLRALLDHPGHVMSRAELLQRTGLAHLGHQPNVVDLAVSRLRRKLPREGLRAQGIRTLRGLGYVWAVDASDAPDALAC